MQKNTIQIDANTTKRNRHALLLMISIATVAVVMTLGFASAYQSGGPPNAMGHSPEELELYPPLYIDTSNDRVGIGTNSPQDNLDINGPLRFGPGAMVAGEARAYIDTNYGLVITGEAGSTHDMVFIEAGGQQLLANPVGTNDVLLVPLSGGNVGIGTTTPSEKLEVDGNINASGFICDSNGCIGSGSGADTDWVENGGNVYRLTGNVGIGTNNPAYTLDVDGTVRIGEGWRGLKIEGSGTEPHRYDFILGDLGGSPANAGGFSIFDDTASAYRLAISKNGAVVIGNTTTPDNSELDIEEQYRTPTAKLEDVARVKIGDAQQIGETGLSNMPYHAINAELTHSRYSGGDISNKFTPEWFGAPQARMTAIIYPYSTTSDVISVRTYNHGVVGSEVDLPSFTEIYSLKNDGGAYFAGDVGIGTTGPGSLLHVSAGTSGDAELILEADTDNNNEADNPFITFKQDANAANAFIGLEGNADTRSTGTIANAFLIGSEDNDPPLQLVTNDNVRMTIATKAGCRRCDSAGDHSRCRGRCDKIYKQQVRGL
jgi:hypothetical protein